MPGWLGPIVTITTQVGVPTVIAGVLLYFVLFRVDGAMKTIQENEESRTRMVAAMQDTLVTTLDRQTTTLEKALTDQTKAFERVILDNIKANQTIAAQLQMQGFHPGSRNPVGPDR